MQKLFIFILKQFGWKYEVTVEIPDKSVICVAPHTSNWDYVIGFLFYKSIINGNLRILAKKELFIFPLNRLFKSMGCIPVDRKKKTSVSEQMVEVFHSEKQLHLAIAPEGTRKRNSKWKTGFYYIALNAGVPITLASIDYAKKEVAIKKNFYPTGDVKSDVDEIKNYYKDIQAKYPERFAIN